MLFILIWFFPKDWLFKRNHGGSEFQIQNVVKLMKNECLESIYERTKSLLAKNNELYDKLKNKIRKHLNVTGNYRDDFYYLSRIKNPIFTQADIERAKKQRSYAFYALLIFIAAETFLYSMTVDLLIPGTPFSVKILFSLVLAFFFYFLLDYAFEKFFIYRKAIELREKNNIPDERIKTISIDKNIGIIFGLASFIAIVAAGFMRVYYLEVVDLTGLTASEIERMEKLGVATTIFSMAITLLAAFFLGVIRKDSVQNDLNYKRYRNWRKNNKETNDYITRMNLNIATIELVMYLRMERYWSLVLDTRRIFRNECDPSKKDFYKEYQDEVKFKGKDVDDAIYKKYENIQSVDEALFKFGILNDDFIIKIKQKLDESRKLVEEVQEIYGGELSIEDLEKSNEDLMDIPDKNDGELKSELETKTN